MFRDIQKNKRFFVCLFAFVKAKKNWWGDNRIDYVLYAPEKITNLPRISLPYIFHSCYWESTDVTAFIVRMVFRHESTSDFDLHEHANQVYRPFNVNSMGGAASGSRGAAATGFGKEPVEKFQKRMNRVKLKVSILWVVVFLTALCFTTVVLFFQNIFLLHQYPSIWLSFF